MSTILEIFYVYARKNKVYGRCKCVTNLSTGITSAVKAINKSEMKTLFYKLAIPFRILVYFTYIFFLFTYVYQDSQLYNILILRKNYIIIKSPNNVSYTSRFFLVNQY